MTITAARTDNGAPPPNLTRVTLTTTLGGFGSAGGPQTLEAELINGQAVVAFFPGGIGRHRDPARPGRRARSASAACASPRRACRRRSSSQSVSPNTGSPQGGETVDIQGGGFDPPIRVTFDGVAATVLSSSESRVSVRTPALAGGLPAGETRPVTVSVTINLNEEGTATDSLPSGFTYTNGGGGGILQPTIFSLTPPSGPNEGGTDVVINGDGFEAPVQVKFGDGVERRQLRRRGSDGALRVADATRRPHAGDQLHLAPAARSRRPTCSRTSWSRT